MFQSGAFVAEYLTPLTDDQPQPNGVDLTVEAVYRQLGQGKISTGSKEIGDREEITPSDGEYSLSPGAYIVEYGETIQIPGEHIGFVYPRSSLIRNSCMLHTAVWDAGYEGRGEGLLVVHTPITLEQHARIGQLVYAEAKHESTYDGSYQHENL